MGARDPGCDWRGGWDEGDIAEDSSHAVSQDLFEAPPKSSKSYQESTDKPNEGEENSTAFGRVALRGAPSSPAEHLTLKRRRKKRMREDMICEILQASAASDHEQRAWRFHREQQYGKGKRKQERGPRGCSRKCSRM